MSISGVGAPGADTRSQEEQALRHVCQELESVFLRQLFQAMRESVEHDPEFGPSEGEAMFTDLLDDQLAQESAQTLDRSLGEALYRQLSQRFLSKDVS
ncbi:MAG: hypothetical protein HKN21_13245 [Candidatus Eisenbacteria bacterium]|uniref:Flagellar protein FlgJ N-terminal domain-containing protein n=1 Tax=Eiseniibacteriota bacterium TaxID=2212470 RepID=A0A7Y2EAZ2_UNCEI|nr:hypothetical protein [Candidatus Eisenbacteria bacterium]